MFDQIVIPSHNRLMIIPDNQSKRRDYSPMLVKTMSFDGITTSQQMTEIITILRAPLNMRYPAALPGASVSP